MNDKKADKLGISKKEQTIRYENWVNEETGEQRQFAVVDKPYNSDYNFHKIWLEDFAKVLNLIGGAKFKVFSEILKIINPFDNKVSFTYRELADICETTTNTVQSTVTKLVSADFMRKVRPSVYQVNSKMLVKGGHNKRMGLMLTYNDLNDGRQLDAFGPSENEGFE